MLCCVFDNYFLIFFFFFIKCFCLTWDFLHGLWIPNEQGHSRQCPSLRCFKALHDYYFFLQMCVPTLWIYFICFFLDTRQEKLDSVDWHSKCVLTAVNEGIYWSFIKLVLEMPYFWAGVDWRRPPPFFHPSKPLGATLTPAHLCLFSDSRWQKLRPYANWQRQVSTWTTADRKTNATSA